MDSSQFKQELLDVVENNILKYWLDHAIDHENGGFYGFVDPQDQPVKTASKGSILNARILWTFSAAFKNIQKNDYYNAARRAYDFVTQYFMDKKFGGIYWEIDYQGNPINRRKQVYALAFAIYALSEYYQISQDPEALETALDLFGLIETHSFDHKMNGYTEALSENWRPIDDVRLSNRDANEKKTMNTHLHLLEAYTSLARVSRDKDVHNALLNLIKLFLEKIIDPHTYHFNLFFDENWFVKSTVISFGHDIEGSWLLHEAAEVYGDPDLISCVKEYSIRLLDAAISGLDSDGGLMYENDTANGHLDSDKHWWPQAEALVGLFNAYQITNNKQYLNYCFNSWKFIKDKMIDHVNGEWFGRVNRLGVPYIDDAKIDFWKCPYHNSRACFELLHRIGSGLTD